MSAKVFFAVIVVGLSASCRTTTRHDTIQVEPIHIRVDRSTTLGELRGGERSFGQVLSDRLIGEKSIAGEIWIGCVAFHAQHDRWPSTAQEVRDGFSLLGREAQFLPQITDLRCETKGDGSLVVEFDATTIEHGRIELRLE